MTIADLIKYVDFLKERVKVIWNKVAQVENLKTTQRIVWQVASWNIEEVQVPLIDAKSLMSEYDEVAKELRLAQQALERANHTTEIKFDAKY